MEWKKINKIIYENKIDWITWYQMKWNKIGYNTIE